MDPHRRSGGQRADRRDPFLEAAGDGRRQGAADRQLSAVERSAQRDDLP
jgi:hypothetical protein